MHPINPMSGHILPVIFFFHFGEQLNDVGHAGKGGLDPDEFWHRLRARPVDDQADIFDPTWDVGTWVEYDRRAGAGSGTSRRRGGIKTSSPFMGRCQRPTLTEGLRSDARLRPSVVV